MCTICLASFLVSLDSYIVNISLPTMARQFQATMNDISLVVLSYILFLAGTSLIFGKLADRYSLKALFIYGYLVFLLGSLLSGLSLNLHLLVASRSLQGIGGAMLLIAGYAALPKYVPQELRGWAFGLMATSAASGVIIGAPIGGIINGYLTWQWVFFINIPICLVAVPVAMKHMPDDSRKGKVNEKAAFDALGAFLSFSSILSLTLMLNKVGEMGWTSPFVILCAVLCITSLALFILREKKYPEPLLHLTIFRNSVFNSALLAAFTAFMVLTGSNFLLPFFLEKRVGLSPANSGLILMIYCVVYVVFAPLSGKVSAGRSPSLVGAAGMISACCSCLLFAFTLHRGLMAVVAYLILMAISFGFFIAPNNNTVMSSVSEDERGAASGVLNLITRISLIAGVCLFEGLFTHFLPYPIGSEGQPEIPPPVLDRAFRISYMAGSLLCLIAALVSYKASLRNRSEMDSRGKQS